VVICLEFGADLHTAQLMPLPLTVSCFSKIQIGFTFLVPAHSGSPGQRAFNGCVCVCVCVCVSCLVNKDEYIMYYAYTSVQSVTTFDGIGRCFRFVYIYACILLFSLLLPFLGD